MKKKKRRKAEDEGRPTKKALTNIDDTTMVPKTQRGNIIYTYGIIEYLKYATYLIIFFAPYFHIPYITLFIWVPHLSHPVISLSLATLFFLIITTICIFLFA